MEHGLDSKFKKLSVPEDNAFRDALMMVFNEAEANKHKRPKVTTLIEEFSEMILAFRGKHEDAPELELTHIASVAINILWQMQLGYHVNNIVTLRDNENIQDSS